MLYLGIMQYYRGNTLHDDMMLNENNQEIKVDFDLLYRNFR